jgi:hypothetical protein
VGVASPAEARRGLFARVAPADKLVKLPERFRSCRRYDVEGLSVSTSFDNVPAEGGETILSTRPRAGGPDCMPVGARWRHHDGTVGLTKGAALAKADGCAHTHRLYARTSSAGQVADRRQGRRVVHMTRSERHLPLARLPGKRAARS